MSNPIQCPGSSTRNLEVDLISCQDCGHEVEMFSDETKRRCPRCKKMVFRDCMPSCVDWCPSARECVGEERWQAMQAGKQKT